MVNCVKCFIEVFNYCGKRVIGLCYCRVSSLVETKSLTIVLMFTTKIDSKLPHRLVANSDYLLTEGFYVLYNPSWVNTMSSNIAPIISHSILSSNLNSHLITTIPANKKATWNDVVFSFRGNSHRKTCLDMRVRNI